MATHKRSIDFTEPQMEWLKKEASKLGIKVGEYVRRIVDEYRMKKQEARK